MCRPKSVGVGTGVAAGGVSTVAGVGNAEGGVGVEIGETQEEIVVQSDPKSVA